MADEKVDKAYICLEGKVKGKCPSLALEEQEFSLLALAYDSGIQAECKKALLDKSNDDGCWPKSACTLKETSIAVLALQRIGADTSKQEDWLTRQNKTPDELLWFLEIDSPEETTCKISYDANLTQNTLTMYSDKRLSLSSSGCFSVENSYWLKIKSGCLNKNFKVSCDKSFISTLLYKKSGIDSNAWNVPSDTKSASANGVTENQVSSVCFEQNNRCDYEGSLWATLALSKKQDINSFLPYLIALAPDNERYNPPAFLYILTGSDEYLNNIRGKQTPAGFWDLSSYGKFYDTSLSLLALGAGDDLAEKSRDWLLSVQGNDGCWQSTKTIADTGFVLYSAWPKTPKLSPDIKYCEDGKYCSSRIECLDVGGNVLDDYSCRDLRICCSKQVTQKTCDEEEGVICKSDEECDGDYIVSAVESRCCSGTCKKLKVSECEAQNFSCKPECLDDEESKIFDCPANICCGKKSSSYWWIYVLVILIILIILGIIFRNQLRLWLFQIRNKFKKGPVTGTRPPFPPHPPSGMPVRRQILPRQMTQPLRQAKSKVDQELEDTLKKLKEMSK